MTHRDVFNAYADQCATEYLLARDRGVSDPVIVLDAPDPTDLDDVEVEARPKMQVALDESTGAALANDLLTTPADRLHVIVLFGDEVHGYTIDRPTG